jgi:hypothetical protein
MPQEATLCTLVRQKGMTPRLQKRGLPASSVWARLEKCHLRTAGGDDKGTWRELAGHEKACKASGRAHANQGARLIMPGPSRGLRRSQS